VTSTWKFIGDASYNIVLVVTCETEPFDTCQLKQNPPSHLKGQRLQEARGALLR